MINLLGHGYWGKKILSTLQNLTQEPITVFDKVITAGVQPISALDEFLSQYSTSDFFFIATPEQTHFPLVKKLLAAKQHVFVEKPLSLTEVEAEELIQMAQANNVNLFVDRIFLHDRGYQFVKKLIIENRIGKINKVESIRHSEDIHKTDISVFDDLAPHDIYLFHDLLNDYPKEQHIRILKKNNQQTTEAKLTWKTQHIEWMNWYSWNTYPTERTFIISGKKGTILWKKGNTEDEVIVSVNNEEQKHLVERQPSTLELVIQDFFNTTKQEKPNQRIARYQQYLAEVAVLESIRVQSSSL